MDKPAGSERIPWEGYPSWKHFIWLYFFSAWTGLRGLFSLRMGIPGWELWVAGAVILLLIVVCLRYWAKYILTSKGIVLRNGYTGKSIANVDFSEVKAIEVIQGPVARFLGIGTIVVQCVNSDRSLRFRGIKDPEVLETKIKALLPASSPIFNTSS